MTAAKRSYMLSRLRFPEFKDRPAWNGLPLDKLEAEGRIELGRGNVISHADMRANPGLYPVYSSSVIDEGLMGTYGDYLFDEELISWSVDGGGHFFYRPKHKFSVTNVSGFMRLHCGDIVCQFLAYQLQRLHGSQTFDYQQKAHPSVIRTLYTVGLPEPDEQQKIADCLGSLDDLIAAESRKLEALRKHKKGLMQQLFPQPGETVPKQRFPEFRDAVGWYKLALSELSKIVRGGSPRPIDAYITDATNGINWLKIGDVSKESKYITHTDQKILPEAIKKTRVVNPGDFILSNSMSFGRPYLLKIRACIHDGWIAVTQLYSAIDENFLYYLMTSDYSQEYFEKSAAGTGVRNLTVDIIKNLPVRFPGSAEQHRIADCLGSLDDLIAAEGRKLKALRQLKQGLMQQLFPMLGS